MRRTTIPAILSLVLVTPAIAAQPRDGAPDGVRLRWITQRVGGDLDLQAERAGDGYRCRDCVIDTALPEGYPAPTPPGAVELKRYPVIRRAEVTGKRAPDRGRNGAFFSLFRHIQSRDIAMTSPVEMDYPDWTGETSSAPESWTMSFVYRTPGDGPLEQNGRVRVVDTAPVTVIAVGLRGEYGRATDERGLQQLDAWLDGQTEWERAGTPRVFYYNGPYVPDFRKWAEVQVPVRRAESAGTPAGEEVGAILRGNFRADGPERRIPSDSGPASG